MDDGGHALLTTQADAAGISMSAYLETLTLSAEDISPGASIGMTQQDLLELLILRAEHVVSWDQKTADALGRPG